MGKPPLLIATTNPGKSREFRDLFDRLDFEIRDLSTLPDAPVVEETGRSFRANACLKARAYARHFRCLTIADDSGLEVDALAGKPGVHSARWAALHDMGDGDKANNRLLIQQLGAVKDEDRTARFVCVLAIGDPEGRILYTASDTIEGRILRLERGTGGFGYDPLFLVNELEQTTAELTAEQKHAISHRGKAMRRLMRQIDRYGLARAPASLNQHR
jgi:XTP/dITP diphosphohydrolase